MGWGGRRREANFIALCTFHFIFHFHQGNMATSAENLEMDTITSIPKDPGTGTSEPQKPRQN